MGYRRSNCKLSSVLRSWVFRLLFVVEFVQSSRISREFLFHIRYLVSYIFHSEAVLSVAQVVSRLPLTTEVRVHS
jgi:hypothetical protein